MPRTDFPSRITSPNSSSPKHDESAPSPNAGQAGRGMPESPGLDGLVPRSANVLAPPPPRGTLSHPQPTAWVGFRVSQPGLADVSLSDLGERIGSGSQKDVFRLRGKPAACVALIRPDAIGHFETPLSHAQREMGALLRLKSRGFRTVEVYALVRVGRQIGIEQAYLPESKNSADIVASGGVVPQGMYLTEAMVEDCEDNITKLRHTSTVVDDLQFLVEKTGNMHITDPRSVSDGDPSKSVGTVKALRGLALSMLLPSDDEDD